MAIFEHILLERYYSRKLIWFDEIKVFVLRVNIKTEYMIRIVLVSNSIYVIGVFMGLLKKVKIDTK